MALFGPKREFRGRVWTAVKAKARTARLAGAEWGSGGPRVAPAGVRGGAPFREMRFFGSLSVVVVALVAVTVGAAVVGSGTQTARTDMLRTAWGVTLISKGSGRTRPERRSSDPTSTANSSSCRSTS